MTKNRSAKGGAHTVVSGFVYVQTDHTNAVPVVNTPLSPSSTANYLGGFSAKLAGISDYFQCFRFTKLVIEPRPVVILSAGTASVFNLISVVGFTGAATLAAD